jgi:hypothetical protein
MIEPEQTMRKPVAILGRMSVAMLIAGLAPMAPSLAQQPTQSERLLKPEKNPPGDSPDNQVFVQYSSPAGFSLKVPEGCSRSVAPPAWPPSLRPIVACVCTSPPRASSRCETD